MQQPDSHAQVTPQAGEMSKRRLGAQYLRKRKLRLAVIYFSPVRRVGLRGNEWNSLVGPVVVAVVKAIVVEIVVVMKRYFLLKPHKFKD